MNTEYRIEHNLDGTTWNYYTTVATMPEAAAAVDEMRLTTEGEWRAVEVSYAARVVAEAELEATR